MSDETRVLHKIVNHLPIQPSVKDALLEEVTAVFGEVEDDDDAAE